MGGSRQLRGDMFGRARRAAVVGAAFVSVAAAAVAAPVAPVAHVEASRQPATASPVVQHRGVVSERPDDGTVQVSGGEVRAIAQVGGKIVVGGTFTSVGPARRGAAGAVDLAVGDFAPGFPDVDGAVLDSAPDGSGGWWLAGSFTSVGGVPRTHLVHVLADGTVDPGFAPVLDGDVRALEAVGDAVVVGGNFTSVDGVPAQRVARIDRAGALVWAGAAPATVLAIEADAAATTVYVGGDFGSYAGVTTTKRLVALDAATGAPSTTFLPGAVNLAVRDLLLSPAGLWVAGDFTKLGNVTRNRVALLNPTTGSLDAFAPGINDRVNAVAVDATGANIYVAGRFSRVGGAAVTGFVGLSTTTGAPTTTALALTGEVSTVVLDGTGGAYIGGAFVLAPEKTNPRTLARVALTTGSVAAVVPSMSLPLSLARPARESSGVRTMQLIGSTLLVAGDFSDFGSISRPYLIAYDATTKALELGFDAQLNDSVRALDGSADGAAVFVGGDFTAAAGTPAMRIAKLSMTDGRPVTGFSTHLDSYAKEIVAHPDGTRVFVGGNFLSTNGTSTERFTTVAADTGAVLAGSQVAFTEPTNAASEGGVRAMALDPTGTKLAVVGNFRRVAGVDRPLVALVDVSDPAAASLLPWSTAHYTQPCTGGRVGWMRDVTFSVDGSTLYTVSSGHYYYPACDSLNAFDATAGGPTSALWTTRPGDTIETVAATKDAVYIGGHFRYLDWEHKTNARFQLGAYDPTSGRPLSWGPNANGFRGVLVMEAEPAGLLMGGDGTAFGLVPHGGFAQFSWPADGLFMRRSADHLLMLASGDTATVTLDVTNATAQPYTITALTDTLSGGMANLGTCTLPVTVPAGSTWTCRFAQAVPSAPALTTTIARTTATGTLGGVARNLGDTTSYQSVTAYRDPQIRTVLAPNTVPFPGGSPTISATVMNESELLPMTVTALTSSLHGDLHGQGTCSLPQTVPPHTMYQCQYAGHVSGAIGTSVSNAISFTAEQGGATSTRSHASSVAVTRPADGGRVLMVVRQVNPVLDADKAMQSRFAALGFTTVLVDDDVASAGDAAGKVLVYLSSTAIETKVAGTFADVRQPVMVALQQLYDDMELTADQGASILTGGTSTGPLHPINSPVVGATDLLTSAKPLTWGTPAPSADVLLVVDSGVGPRASEFVYQPGDALIDGSAAPGCRIGFPAERTNVSAWRAAFTTRFQKSVWWAVYGCGTGIIGTVAGTGANTVAADGGTSTRTGISDPMGVLADGHGGFFYADFGGHRIRHVDAEGVVTTIAGTGTAGSSGDGGPAAAARLNTPARIRRDLQGRLVIVDLGNARIRRIEANGTITTIAGTGTKGFSGDGGPATAARLNAPQDVAWNAAGEMFIADRLNQRIRKVAANGVISTVAGTGTAGYDGDEVLATSARLSNPYGVAVTADGTLLIADMDNSRIRSVDAAGYIHTVAGTGVLTAAGDGGPAILADLHKPFCVVAGAGGGFLICDYNNNRVRHVDADGVITTVIGVGTSGFSGDGDLAVYARGNRFADVSVAPSGDVYIVDRLNRRIRLINA